MLPPGVITGDYTELFPAPDVLCDFIACVATALLLATLGGCTREHIRGRALYDFPVLQGRQPWLFFFLKRHLTQTSSSLGSVPNRNTKTCESCRRTQLSTNPQWGRDIKVHRRLSVKTTFTTSWVTFLHICTSTKGDNDWQFCAGNGNPWFGSLSAGKSSRCSNKSGLGFSFGLWLWVLPR